MTDEWNGFAYLMANLIEKYAAEISFDDLPTFRKIDENNKIESVNIELSVDNNNVA